MIAYFRQHERLLGELVRLGVEHPALYRVEPAMKKFPSYHGSPTEADLAAERRAYEILSLIKADLVVYWRVGSTPEGALISVDVPVYRFGLSLGGYSTSLTYIPDFATEPPQSDEKRKFRRIEDTGWFIEESDTR